MTKLNRILSLAEFLKTYDAGGYFWSPFTAPRDGVVTAGEVAKGTQRVAANAEAFLQLEMQLDDLRPAERDEAIRRLDKWMTARRTKLAPARTTPGRMTAQVRPGKTVILGSVVATAVNRETVEPGLKVQLWTGASATLSWAPVRGHFALYRLHSAAGPEAGEAILLAPRRTARLPEGRIKVGGTVVTMEASREFPDAVGLLGHAWIEA